MTTYNTGNALGSTDPRDLYDNAENADFFENGQEPFYADRLGTNRKSRAGMESDFQQFLTDSGYIGTGAGGAFEDYDVDGPLTINARNEIFTKDGEFYKAKSSLTLPYTTTGTWVGDDETRFVSVGDAALRQEIGSGIRRVATLSSLEGISGRFSGDVAYMVGRTTAGDGGEGEFRWDGSDLSSTLVLASVTSTSVDATTDTITSAGHGLVDGNGVVTTTAVNGLTANQVYWVIGATTDTFQLSATFGGAAVDLTGTANFTVEHLLDPLKGIYVTATDDPTGISGAWVRQRLPGECYFEWFGLVSDAAATDQLGILVSAMSLESPLGITSFKSGLSGEVGISNTWLINSGADIDLSPWIKMIGSASTIKEAVRISGSCRVRKIRVDRNRAIGTFDGSFGTQPAVRFGTGGEKIVDFVHVKNSIDEGISAQGDTNTHIKLAILENCGEHGFYLSTACSDFIVDRAHVRTFGLGTHTVVAAAKIATGSKNIDIKRMYVDDGGDTSGITKYLIEASDCSNVTIDVISIDCMRGMNLLAEGSGLDDVEVSIICESPLRQFITGNTLTGSGTTRNVRLVDSNLSAVSDSFTKAFIFDVFENVVCDSQINFDNDGLAGVSKKINIKGGQFPEGLRTNDGGEIYISNNAEVNNIVFANSISGDAYINESTLDQQTASSDAISGTGNVRLINSYGNATRYIANGSIDVRYLFTTLDNTTVVNGATLTEVT